MSSLKAITMLITGLLLTASLATADEIIIIHHSGKVQTIPLNDSSDPVEQVSFRRSEKPVSTGTVPTQTTPAVSPAAEVKTSKQPDESPVPPMEQPAKSSDKPKIIIKWAEPADPM